MFDLSMLMAHKQSYGSYRINKTAVSLFWTTTLQGNRLGPLKVHGENQVAQWPPL